MAALLLLLRSIVWATVLAVGITALIAWRTSPELRMTLPVATTMFGIVWVLCFIPSVIAELLIAHLKIELGEVKGSRRRWLSRWRFRA